jgi:hypothetical protein
MREEKKRKLTFSVEKEAKKFSCVRAQLGSGKRKVLWIFFSEMNRFLLR